MAIDTKMMTAAEVVSEIIPSPDFDVNMIPDNIILMSQDHYIKDVLGEDFYDDLITKIAASTLNSDETTLMNKLLKPTLAYAIMYEVLPHMRNHIGTEGLMHHFTDNSEQAQGKDFHIMRHDMLSKYGKMRDRMIEWLDDNEGKFDEYEGGKETPSGGSGVVIY